MGFCGEGKEEARITGSFFVEKPVCSRQQWCSMELGLVIAAIAEELSVAVIPGIRVEVNVEQFHDMLDSVVYGRFGRSGE